MEFEYDEKKSQINKLKHGIDFEEAKKLWMEPLAFEIPSSKEIEEERFLVFGKIEEKLYVAIITYRNQKIRIISVRRARKKETKLYESITNR